ncbi:MAG: hypothetical protein ACE37B_20765 [Ilumatobacter sp.]|jgi:hypothetical protein|uniref:hypothetical protein n=1 Tax=Ilumatobacter sp. TaxID=1967498 RepID=UPI00391AE442
MGFFKDVRKLQQAGREASKHFDPAAQMRAASAQMSQMADQATLMSTGEAATATVSAIRNTSTMINANQLCEVDLLVMPSVGAPFPATATVQGAAGVAGLVPGTRLSVRYDPSVPTSVAIVGPA